MSTYLPCIVFSALTHSPSPSSFFYLKVAMLQSSQHLLVQRVHHATSKPGAHIHCGYYVLPQTPASTPPRFPLLAELAPNLLVSRRYLTATVLSLRWLARSGDVDVTSALGFPRCPPSRPPRRWGQHCSHSGGGNAEIFVFGSLLKTTNSSPNILKRVPTG
ncbi:hypothetical protein B0H19DRAFT_1231146, partial [Mycena capillaripes]